MTRHAVPFLACFLAWAAISATPAGEEGFVITPRQEAILRDLLELSSGAAPEGGPAGERGGRPWTLDVWDTDAGLEKIVAFPANRENAAADFRRLEELYPGERELLEENAAEAAGVDLLLRAAEKGECRLAPDHYPEFDRVTARQPDFLVLRTYLKGLTLRADRAEARGDAAEAERCHRAALLCGRHLTRDKSSVLVYLSGVIFKLRGAQGYERFLRRAGRIEAADAAKAYLDAVVGWLRVFNWKAGVALGEMKDFACLPAAMRIALFDAEPAWRKEAVVRLAILRHGVPDLDSKVIYRDAAMERRAEETLAAVAEEDPDPTVRRLAVWAIVNVRPETYGEMEQRF